MDEPLETPDGAGEQSGATAANVTAGGSGGSLPIASGAAVSSASFTSGPKEIVDDGRPVVWSVRVSPLRHRFFLIVTFRSIVFTWRHMSLYPKQAMPAFFGEQIFTFETSLAAARLSGLFESMIQKGASLKFYKNLFRLGYFYLWLAFSLQRVCNVFFFKKRRRGFDAAYIFLWFYLYGLCRPTVSRGKNIKEDHPTVDHN